MSYTGKNKVGQLTDFEGTMNNAYYVELAVNNGKITPYHLTAGVTYTLSCNVVASEYPTQLSVGAGNGAFSRDIRSRSDITANGRWSLTFTPTETMLSQGSIFAFRIPRYGTIHSGVTYKISDVQLEIGDTATAYERFVAPTVLEYNRTQQDVNAIRSVISKYLNGEALTLAEQDLWNSNAKGCLNPSDLNRWGYAMNAIATSLQEHGYSVTADAKTNWANTDYMTQAQNEAIINKLHELYMALNDLFIEEGNLRAVFGGGQQTGLTTLPVSYAILAEPSWASLDLVDVDVNTLDYSTINDWNAIERFLYDAFDFLERIGG